MARKKARKTPGNPGEPSRDKKSEQGRASAGTGGQRKGSCTNLKGGEKKAKQRQGYPELKAGRGPVLFSTIVKATGMSSKRVKRAAKNLSIPLVTMKSAPGKNSRIGKPPDAFDCKSANAFIGIYNEGVNKGRTQVSGNRPRPTSPPVPESSIEDRPRPSLSSLAPLLPIFDVESLAAYLGLPREKIVEYANKGSIKFLDFREDDSGGVTTDSLIRFSADQVDKFLLARSR